MLLDKPVVNVCDLLRIVLVQLGHPHAENLKMSQMLNCDYVIEYIISWNLVKEIQCRYAFTFALSDYQTLQQILVSSNISIKYNIRCLD